MALLPRTVDRSLARMIATKRLITGTLAIGAGFVPVALAIGHGAAPPAQLYFALLIFWGGGAWALRDGLRLRRELQR